MQKKFWYQPPNWDKKLITAAIESGFEAIYVAEKDIEKTRELSRAKIISTKAPADFIIGENADEVKIENKECENRVVAYKGKIPVIIRNFDWTIIPLENLISKTSNLIQHVRNYNEAKLAFLTLEIGSDGILLETGDLNEIKKTAKLIKEIQNEKLELCEAEIISIEQLGLGDRVVVDTASTLSPGQGMLVGDSSKAMFLVYNENVETPYCDPRPFRVNAGGTHAYIRMPGDKTKYLGELKSGLKALVVDQKGNTEEVIVGRVKIERRPMLIVRGIAGGRELSLVMQNAETIRLTKNDGSPVSVTKLKPGDRVLAFIQEEEMGRHFGQKIKETITEK
ncbi:MAG: 3-dehydroquinate synthase II [Patescibacteria group bacterium]|jgi:3-dehydroquinate synthase II